MKNKEIPVSELPIMEKCCKSCPFIKDEKGRVRDPFLTNKVIERNLFKSQQICHGTEGKNREARNRCRGYYDYSKVIYDRLGLKDIIKV